MASFTTRESEVVEKTTEVTVDFCLEQAAKALTHRSMSSNTCDVPTADAWVKIAYAIKDCAV